MDTAVRIGSVLLLIAAAVLLWRMFTFRRDAVRNVNKVTWIKRETARAVTLLRSDKRTDILAGLQILQALNDPVVVSDVLPILLALRSSSDVRIAAHAEETLLSLTRLLERTTRTS